MTSSLLDRSMAITQITTSVLTTLMCGFSAHADEGTH
jgi:hypothetical protein